MPKTSQKEKEKWDWSRISWLRHAPYAIGAFLFHLILLLMLATLIIFRPPAPEPDPTTFGGVKVKVPPPPVPPAAAGGEAANALEPAVTITPPPSQSSIVTANTSQTFNLSSTKVTMPNLPSVSKATGSALSNTGLSGVGHGAGSVFGSDSSGGNGFVGYLYDLKQSPTHVPTGMNSEKEQGLLKQFFSGGWNEDDWAKKYFKSPTPLYANELMVPLIFSKEGPKAFKIEKVCKPGYWCAIYHLKITSNRSGTFRVAGYGDDFLVVRVNGDIVLDSGWFKPVTKFKREKIFPAKWLKRPSPGRPDYGQTVVGAPFHLDVAETVTIDVLLGDSDDANGQGRCGYFLFLLQDGKEYDKDAAGNPVLPALQVQPEPNLERKGEVPPFSSKPEDALLGS